MDIWLDIMNNGQHIIYLQHEDETIEEPCGITITRGRDGKTMQPNFIPFLGLSDKGVVHHHNLEQVLYHTRPNTDLYNWFIKALKQFRAQRSGIVAPTSAQIHRIK